MKMKAGHESEWLDVCGNCAFYDGTQTTTHCCEVHLHTRLKTGGSCHSFIYDHSHYGKDYGIETLTENQIKQITVGYSNGPQIPLEGEQMSYSETDFSLMMEEDGTLSLWTEDGHGVKLNDDVAMILMRVCKESMKRKGLM